MKNSAAIFSSLLQPDFFRESVKSRTRAVVGKKAARALEGLYPSCASSITAENTSNVNKKKALV